jgi:translation initiation factor IF-1
MQGSERSSGFDFSHSFDLCIATASYHLWIFLQNLPHLPDKVRVHYVVIVKQTEVFSLRLFNTAIEMREVDQHRLPAPVFHLGKLGPHHLLDLVVAGIVRNDQFKVLITLNQDRMQRLPGKVRTVMTQHENRK